MWSLYSAILMPVPDADCPKQIAPAAIEASLSELETAFVAKDISGVRKAYKQTNAAMSCLNGPLSRQAAQKYHLFSGLIAWLNKDKDTFKSHVAWLKAMDSKGSIDTKLFPKGHVIHSEYTETPVEKLGPSAKKPKTGKIYIDGVERGKRVPNTPTILQMQNEAGDWQTQVLKPSEALPSYAVDNFKTEALWTAVGTATLGMGLFATALKYRSDYKSATDDGITASDRAPLTYAFEQNQKFGLAAYAITGISVAIGAWAVLQD